MMLVSALAGGSRVASGADNCPTDADAIVTDRPDITNSSLVVPWGSLQAENGVDWVLWRGANALDAPNAELRFGVAPCTEFFINVPSYFAAMSRAQPSGFSDVVASLKRQLPAPFGFELSATAGLGFPTGLAKISGSGYEPYIEFPWSRGLAPGWTADGMFTFSWFPADSSENLIFQPTLEVERELGSQAEVFLEYVGDYGHQRPAHLLDAGGALRVTKTQQVDFHIGAGLNRGSSALNGMPAALYIGVGYSIRFDRVFGGFGGNSS
jgi:hypothetical protein